MNYIWDTNIVIYYLQKQFPENADKFIDLMLLNDKPVISAITEIELLCWKSATSNDIKTIKSFVDDSFVIELEQAVKEKTAQIRKLHNLKLPDAIIAASAIVYGLTLITRNTKDFKNIKKLSLKNPWEI